VQQVQERAEVTERHLAQTALSIPQSHGHGVLPLAQVAVHGHGRDRAQCRQAAEALGPGGGLGHRCRSDLRHPYRVCLALLPIELEARIGVNRVVRRVAGLPRHYLERDLPLRLGGQRERPRVCALDAPVIDDADPQRT